MVLFYLLNGDCEPQMGAKRELGVDEAIFYYENNTVTRIITINGRAFRQARRPLFIRQF